MTGEVVWMALCAGGAAAGACLLAAGVRGTLPRPTRPPTRWNAAMGFMRDRRNHRWLLAAVIAAVAATLLTRWPVFGVAAGVFVVAGPWLFGGRAAEDARTRKIEALATWIESLRDTMAGAHSLQQVLPATANTVPPVLVTPVERMLARMRAQTPLTSVLIEFGRDLDDPVADQVVAALVGATEVRGPQLGERLSLLAASARAEVEMRRRTDARRRPIQRNTRIITVISVAVFAFLSVFGRGYFQPFGTVEGQVVMVVICAMFGLCFIALRRLGRIPPAPRLPVRTEARR